MANIDWVAMLQRASTTAENYSQRYMDNTIHKRNLFLSEIYSYAEEDIANRIRKQLAAGRLAQRQAEEMMKQALEWRNNCPLEGQERRVAIIVADTIVLAAGDIQEADNG